MGEPTLSIIMPNYNHAHFVGEALEAILAQSFRPLEVIVVDDGSTDNSISVIDQFAKRDPIVRLLKNDKNMGVEFSVNRGLEHSSGSYLYFPAADDRVMLGFFEKSMKLLAEYPQAGLSFSESAILCGQTGAIREIRLRLSDQPAYYTPTEFSKLIYGRGMLFAGNSSILKRTAFIEAGGYKPELRWHCDGFTCLVMALRYGVVHIPEPLAAFRVVPDSYSHQRLQNMDAEREVLRNMLCLLDSPDYQDVLPLIKKTGFVGAYGRQMVWTLLRDPIHWGYFSTGFISLVLRNGTVYFLKKLGFGYLYRKSGLKYLSQIMHDVSK
ncbi:MAG: putative glycosyltransferase EpsJ [Dehalococcoidia bacterium]|nr:putative glycosyltransferase EpsJ [Bacillota bacterium]